MNTQHTFVNSLAVTFKIKLTRKFNSNNHNIMQVVLHTILNNTVRHATMHVCLKTDRYESKQKTRSLAVADRPCPPLTRKRKTVRRLKLKERLPALGVDQLMRRIILMEGRIPCRHGPHLVTNLQKQNLMISLSNESRCHSASSSAAREVDRTWNRTTGCRYSL